MYPIKAEAIRNELDRVEVAGGLSVSDVSQLQAGCQGLNNAAWQFRKSTVFRETMVRL
jgi:hypothetical protein